MALDGISVTAVITICFNYFIFCPLIIYFLYLFRKYAKQNNPYITQRNPKLVYTLNVLTLFAILFERLSVCIIQVWNIINSPIWVPWMLFSLTWWALLDLFAVKVYNLHYRQQYMMRIAELSWKQDLNPNAKNDWYITNNNKYGNIIHLIKLISIPYLISVIIVAFIFPVFIGVDLWFNFVMFTVATIPIIIAFITFYKIGNLNDLYRIRNEILYQLILIALIMLIYCITFLIFHFKHSVYNHVHLSRMEWLSYTIELNIVAFAMSVLTTAYPVYLAKQNERHSISKQRAFTQSFIEDSPSRKRHYSTSIQSMVKILANYNMFRLFMNYLIKEFAAENLLFLTELIQIKHSYQKQHDYVLKVKLKNTVQNNEINQFMVIDFNVDVINNIYFDIRTPEKDRYFTYLFHSEKVIMTKLLLPVNIPETNILEDYNQTLYSKMKMLYFKYIKDGAIAELNVPYSTRYALVDFFENSTENEIDDNDVFNIMDGCAMEILFLMQGSYARFVGTTEFDEAHREFNYRNNNVAKNAIDIKNLLNSSKSGVITITSDASSKLTFCAETEEQKIQIDDSTDDSMDDITLPNDNIMNTVNPALILPAKFSDNDSQNKKKECSLGLLNNNMDKLPSLKADHTKSEPVPILHINMVPPKKRMSVNINANS